MSSNFALSLSFEGIRLLHRVPGGWNLVSAVALDCDDLGAELAGLREMALQLEPGGMRTKLLIPDSQIRYLTIESAQTSLEDVHRALDGATPYALEDLVIDFDRTGGRTYIAAVARETLVEAESFAADHKLGPICFAAVPEPLTFRGEVFFGPTTIGPTLMNGAPITRDDAAVKQTGRSVFPSQAAEDDGSVLPGFLAKSKPQDRAPEIVFSSRSKPTTALELAGATAERQSAAPAVTTPALSAPSGRFDSPAIATLEMVRQFPAPPVVMPAVAGDALPAASQGFSTRRSPGFSAIDNGPVLRAPLAEQAPAVPAGVADLVTAQPEVKPARAPARKRSERARKVGGKPRFLGLILTAGLLLLMTLVALWANTLGEDGIAGWFNRSAETEIAVNPAVQAVSDAISLAAAPVAVTLPESAPTLAPSVLDTEPVPADVVETAPLPMVSAPLGRVLSPADAERIYAATGVYQRAPRLPYTTQDATLDTLQRASLLVAPDRLPTLAMPHQEAMLPDPVIPSQPNPPGPDMTFARDARGFILATPDGTVTPDGVVVIASAPPLDPPVRPGTETTVVANADVAPVPEAPAETQDVAISASTQAATAELPGDAVAILTPVLTPKTRPGTIASAVAPANTVVINPDDVRTVDGAALITFKPRTRPETLAPAVTQAAVIQSDPALAGYRPALRPGDLAPLPDNDTAEAEPEALPEPDISAVIAAIAEAAPPSAFQNVTARAIAASPRPDLRPRNFAQVVARAQANLARSQAPARATEPAPTAVAAAAPAPQAPARAAVAASAAIAAPSGPVPGSVAQAATIDGAIRLRDMNLIGVFGRPNARRALVRLGNGQMVRVEVGSALDGGQVTAIGDSALNFVKRGRTYALQLPQS